MKNLTGKLRINLGKIFLVNLNLISTCNIPTYNLSNPWSWYAVSIHFLEGDHFINSHYLSNFQCYEKVDVDYSDGLRKLSIIYCTCQTEVSSSKKKIKNKREKQNKLSVVVGEVRNITKLFCLRTPYKEKWQKKWLHVFTSDVTWKTSSPADGSSLHPNTSTGMEGVACDRTLPWLSYIMRTYQRQP